MKRRKFTSGPPPKGAWRKKLHPLFIKSAEINRRVVILARSGKPEDRTKIDQINREEMPTLLEEAGALYDSMKPKGQIRHLGYLQALGIDSLPPGTELPEPEFIFRWLCWFRFGKTIQQLTQEYGAGDPKAVKQMNKLRLEFDLWRIGDVDPNKLKFKIDLDHFTLMNGGFDLGMEDLTGEELADCFDELCPCGQQHFAENLIKLRSRIIREFPPTQAEDAPDSTTRDGSPT